MACRFHDFKVGETLVYMRPTPYRHIQHTAQVVRVYDNKASVRVIYDSKEGPKVTTVQAENLQRTKGAVPA